MRLVAAAARRILLQEVITWPMLCELIVMDLDPTFLIWRSLTTPAVSEPGAEGLVGETFARIKRKRHRERLILASLARHTFPLIACGLKPTSEYDPTSLLFVLDSHFNHNRCGNFYPQIRGDPLEKRIPATVASSSRKGAGKKINIYVCMLRALWLILAPAVATISYVIRLPAN